MPRFDFAISFAGPERALARTLAQSLSRTGLRVFFDELFEHEMLGTDGADYLNGVFFEQSRYCVALVSESYEKRAWAQLERRAAQAREHVAGPGVLLPVLVDATRPSWLLPTRVYFNLAERSLTDLIDVLNRKHAGDLTSFRKVFEVVLDRTDAPFLVSAGWNGDDFFVRCSRADEGQRQVIRLQRENDDWQTQDLPIRRPSRWLLHGEASTLVGIPNLEGDTLQIYRRGADQVTTLRPPRNYRWKSPTDANERDGQVLIAYCGGDVWHLRPDSMAMCEVRPGSNEVQYTYADFWNDYFVVALEERCEVEIRRLDTGALVSQIVSPIPAEGLRCFPEADLIAITGLDSVATIRFSNGEVVATEELIGLDLPAESPSETTLLGISEFPWPSNTLEIIDTTGPRRVRFRRPVGAHRWSNLAVSASGATVAAVRGNTILLFTRSS
jgi:TIR domain